MPRGKPRVEPVIWRRTPGIVTSGIFVIVCCVAAKSYLYHRWLQVDYEEVLDPCILPKYSHLSELLEQKYLFPREHLEEAGCHLNKSVPPVLILDDFFDRDEAEAAREKVLTAWQGAAGLQMVKYELGWWVSTRSSDAKLGWNESTEVRHMPVELQKRFSQLIGDHVDSFSWKAAGDRWNGALHVKLEDSTRTALHTHFHDKDVSCGWVGIVYLSHHSAETSGTTFWADSRSGTAVKPKGRFYSDTTKVFEKLFTVAPKFNRLVLHRADVLHSGSRGFGTASLSEEPRLFATYFFNIQSPSD